MLPKKHDHNDEERGKNRCSPLYDKLGSLPISRLSSKDLKAKERVPNEINLHPRSITNISSSIDFSKYVTFRRTQCIPSTMQTNWQSVENLAFFLCTDHQPIYCKSKNVTVGYTDDLSNRFCSTSTMTPDDGCFVDKPKCLSQFLTECFFNCLSRCLVFFIEYFYWKQPLWKHWRI